jgi:uncharacterized protein YecE (DUF72 family)
MDFGRLNNVEGISFSFPPDHPDTVRLLKSKPAVHAKVYVGCPIWTHPGWIGKIYPRGAKPKDYLNCYAQQFNTIETNTTHYAIPSSGTIELWKASVTKGFKFCPKVPQQISHVKDISLMVGPMFDFMERMRELGDCLGTAFLQLPGHFKADQLDKLLQFLDRLPEGVQLAIELRHESWFEDITIQNQLMEYLRMKKIGMVITDVLGRQDVLHQRLTNKTAFIRFGANNLHPTDFVRLDNWTNRILNWLASGLRQAYFFIHTPERNLCPELADYFISGLNKKADTLLLPPPKIQSPNIQGSLFS